MSVIVDVSLTLAWYFDDETTPETEAVLDQLVRDGGVAPMLWRLEVANGLQSAVRRKRTDARYRDTALAELPRLSIELDPDTIAHAWTTTLRLSEQFALTVYDAAYLELSQRKRPRSRAWTEP